MTKALMYVALVITVAAVGAVMIVAGAAAVTLHVVAWPFVTLQARCGRLLRALNPRASAPTA
jgi:hypothetical protein